MNKLSKEEFLSRKKRDAIAMIGSGYSINSIDAKKWDNICGSHDLFGMNWSCIGPKNYAWYLVREQAATPKRIGPRQTLEDFIEYMSTVEATLIVKDISYQPNNYIHANNTDKFGQDGMVFKEIPGKCSVDAFADDIFDIGIHHGKNTMTDFLHFAVAMGYKSILFVGVDLYDSRYFWLPYDEPSPMVKFEGRSVNEQHLAAGNTLKLIDSMKMAYPNIEMAVENERSLLSDIIPVMKI